MGISRLTRSRWLAVPMVAATIGLSAPAAANAVTAPTTSTTSATAASTTASSVSTIATTNATTNTTTNPSAADGSRATSTTLLTPNAVEVSLGSFVGDARGSDRFRRL